MTLGNYIPRAQKGFTLVELLIYIAVFGVVATLFVGILAITTRVQERAIGINELNTQINFTLQTIQRLVRSSSNIEFAGNGDNPDTAAREVSYLKLRMPTASQDPTCVALVDDGTIRITEGTALSPSNPNARKCRDSTSADALTASQVSAPISPAPGLAFTKFSNYPGHDVVQITLTLNYAGTGNLPISRTLQTAIGRASAATFDSDLLPACASGPCPPATLPNLGSSIAPWENVYAKNLLEKNYTGPVGGGYKVIGTTGGNSALSCQATCQTHSMSCVAQYRLDVIPSPIPSPFPNPPPADPKLIFDCNPAYVSLCFCQSQ